MILSNKQKQSAAEAIVTTRDFCGDEREAVRDWCADNGVKFSDIVYRQAAFRANAIWNKQQRAAGVPEKHLF